MLLLSEGTLFFWDVYHALIENSKDELLGKVNDWRVAIKSHSRTPSISPQQPNTPPPTSTSQCTTTVDKSTHVSSTSTAAEKESTLEEDLVGAFGDDEMDDDEEQAALASSSKEIEAVRIYLNYHDDFLDLQVAVTVQAGGHLG